MTAVPELSRAEARRMAVRAQLLDLPRPTDLVDTVRHLMVVQLEPTRPIAASADLVLWSRLGEGYTEGDLREALDVQLLVEVDGRARAADDIALLRAEMDAWPGPEPRTSYEQGQLDWVEANDACRRDLLERLRGDGPLPASALPDTCVVPWRSSGWNNSRNVLMMLTRLAARGEVAVAGQEGREKTWDLAERIYPDADPLPLAEARHALDVRRLASLGIARPGRRVVPFEPTDVGDVGVPVRVEGTRGLWRADPDQLARLEEPLDGRAALLSPFDRLIADRKRTTELFDYDYVLEMYKPEAKRRWGYYALPVLVGDRLVGKLDARAERDAGVLVVNALHEDGPLDPPTRAVVDAEIDALAAWLGLSVTRPR